MLGMLREMGCRWRRRRGAAPGAGRDLDPMASRLRHVGRLTVVCQNRHNSPMAQITRKPVKWVGSAKRDLDAMPEDVKDVFGHAIDVAQAGGKHPDAKAMSGFGSASALEVVEDYRGDTYRAVYTVKFSGWIYVLHCFQKKSKRGIATPKEDMELIRARFRAAKSDFEAWKATQGARR